MALPAKRAAAACRSCWSRRRHRRRRRQRPAPSSKTPSSSYPWSHSQQVVREVAAAEGLEVELVGRFELALLQHRFLREAGEALAHFARQLEVLEHRLMRGPLD